MDRITITCCIIYVDECMHTRDKTPVFAIHFLGLSSALHEYVILTELTVYVVCCMLLVLCSMACLVRIVADLTTLTVTRCKYFNIG